MRLQLVPSERQVEALALLGQRAMTLRQLVRELADKAAPNAERAGPEVTRLVAESAAPSPELAELLESGMGALRRLGFGPAELGALPGSRAALFSQALTHADAALERAKLRDERGDPWLATSVVDAALLPEVTELSVAAWVRLGSAELRLLERVHQVLRARGGAGVSVVFPGITGEESGRAVEVEQGRLEARWASANDPPSITRERERPAAQAQLRVRRTTNLASEARAAVRAVQECLASGGKLDRIAIVPLEPSEAFLEELRSALRSARLPFSEPRGRPPIAGPNVHATLELLRLVGGPIRRDALLDVLAAPGLRPNRWFGPDGRRALLALRELLARTPVGVDRDGQLLLARARALVEQRESRGASPDEPGALAGFERLLDDLMRLGRRGTRALLARDFRELVGDLGLLQPTAHTLQLALERHDAGSPGLLTALSDDGRGAEALDVALGRLVEAAERLGLGDEQVSPLELSLELMRAIEGVGMARGAARAAAVAVARPAEVAGLELDLAVVCRASAACFGKSGAGPAALALGAELCDALPAERRPPSARDEQTATLVALGALVATAARTEIVWSTSDGSSETRESRWVEAWLHAQPGSTQLDEPGSALSPGARRITPLAPPSEQVRLRAKVELARQAFFFGQGSLDELTGQVAPLSAWVAPHLPPLPVTRLERYADCAFLGFSAIVLRASRDENVSDALGVRERGILIHAAIAEALSAIAGQLGRPDDELLRTALAAAERALSAHAGSELRGAALRATLADGRSFVRWSLENRDFSFKEAEKGFGDGEQWAALELGPYRVSGRIDRIDVSTDGRRARVIDYKSGQAPSKKDEHALQGWLYARKVAGELGVGEVQSLYLGLSRRVPHAKLIFEGAPDSPALLEREAHALASLERLSAGRVAADPTRPSRCARCDARDLCRRPLSAPLGDEEGEEA